MRHCEQRSHRLWHEFGFLPNSFIGHNSIELQEVLAVVFQFVNRLMHVSQCGVPLLLLEGCMDLGPPAFGQFLQRADIQVAVVEEGLQLGHVLDQKPPVLPDGIATHG